MILNGLKIRKALELDLSVENIFRINTEEEGDSVAKEIYEDEITHTSEIENIKELFGEDTFLYCSSKKKETEINKNLKAYTYSMYMASVDSEDINVESKISSEKSSEVFFLSTKTLSYPEFQKNIMDAQRFLGNFESGIFKRKFAGIGDFTMEEYSDNHSLVNFSGLHLLHFYVKDSGIVSTVGNILAANYEKDIIEQREYFSDEEYEKLLSTVKHHKMLVAKGINYGMK